MDCTKMSLPIFLSILFAGAAFALVISARERRWFGIGLLCLLASIGASAWAQPVVGVHVGSWHSEPGYNNANPGLHVRSAEGWTAGGYCNSESRSSLFPDAPACRLSVYAGRTWQTEDWHGLRAGVTVAGVTGYQRAPVLPAAIPSVLIGGHVRLLYAPKIEPKGTNVVSLVLETAF